MQTERFKGGRRSWRVRSIDRTLEKGGTLYAAWELSRSYRLSERQLDRVACWVGLSHALEGAIRDDYRVLMRGSVSVAWTETDFDGAAHHFTVTRGPGGWTVATEQGCWWGTRREPRIDRFFRDDEQPSDGEMPWADTVIGG